MKYFSMFSGIGGFEYGIHNAYRSSIAGEQDYSEALSEARQRFQPTQGQDTCSSQRRNSERPTNWIDQRPFCIGFSEIDKYAVQIYQKHFKEHKHYGNCTQIDWSTVPDFDCLVGGFPCQSFSIAGKRGGFTDTRGTLFFEIARCLREKQPRLCVLENVKGLLSHDKGATFFTIISTLDELGYDVEWQVLNSKNFGVPQNRERVFIIGHLRGTGGGKVFPIGNDDRKFDENIVERTGIRSREVSNAIDANYWKGADGKRTMLGEGMRIRRLTPTECERLQGFPDGWTYGISDTQRYKCLGNAVTTNVITAIFDVIFAAGGEDRD